MAVKRLSSRSLDLTRVWILTSARTTPQLYHPPTTPSWTRPFNHHPIHSASPTPIPPSSSKVVHPRDTPSPQVPTSEDPASDSARHAAFLGEADSDDAHEAHRDAYGAPDPSLDASNSAFLGEADSNDGFEVQRDAEGQPLDPVDATHSAFLGEADSDDGFEGRRAVYPEEGDHGIEDASFSGDHGQAGEGDRPIEHDRR
jgi:hypothetical protein